MMTKIKIGTIPMILIGFILLLTNSCQKDDESSEIKDQDGNVYTSVTVGTQVWLVENLNTTKYKDGATIPLVTGDTEWGNLSTPGYCWVFNNQAAYGTIYGALYNWYAVNTGKLCPAGWHVPTDAEWTTLENYLIANGFNYDETTTGNKIAKSMAGTTQWSSSNTTGSIGSTDYTSKRNSSGFAALPGGFRQSSGSFPMVFGASEAYFWSSTENGADYARARYLLFNYVDLRKGSHYKTSGFSVRCIKD